jgi:hypothetical protein
MVGMTRIQGVGRLIALFAAVLLMGCEPLATGLLKAPEHGVQISPPPFTLDPGQETSSCYTQHLKNASPIHVIRLEAALGAGFHHFTVYQTDESTSSFGEGFASCPDELAILLTKQPILGGTRASVDYSFPDGLALELPANAVITIRLHFLNATTQKQTAEMAVNFYEPPDAGPKELVGGYGLTTFEINLPPHQQTTITKDCTMHDRMRLLTMSSHFHGFGIGARAQLTHAGEAPITLYESTGSGAARIVAFDRPPLVLEGDVIHFECTYDNEQDVPVHFGLTAKDEMCFVFGYYYHDTGPVACI